MKQFVVFAFAALTIASALAADDNWPQFRGPNGDGHAESSRLPFKWSEREKLKWRTAIHGKAWSSPVVWGSQVWMTTATENGKELYAVCVDRESGQIIHDLKLFTVEKPQFCHEFNSYASPTPVIEAGRVYVTFGSPGTACLDTQTGKVLWERRDFVCNHFRGAGSSPILHRDLLVMTFDGSDHQFICALDKNTGKAVWQTNRSMDYKDTDASGKPQADGDFRKAFSTPHVAEFDGRLTLISMGAKATYGYDPLTGKEFWRVEERTSHSAGTRPVVGHGLIFAPTGWSNGQLLAIHPGENGEVIDANNTSPDAVTKTKVAWKLKRGVPRKPSLLLVNDLLFMIDDGGFAACVEAKTGAEVWRERIGGNYSAAPLYGNGRIYFFSEEGKTTVIEAKREFAKLAENLLAGGFMASPAVAGDALFLRTKTHLYRIQD